MYKCKDDSPYESGPKAISKEVPVFLMSKKKKKKKKNKQK
jgi:hypothetical protein